MKCRNEHQRASKKEKTRLLNELGSGRTLRRKVLIRKLAASGKAEAVGAQARRQLWGRCPADPHRGVGLVRVCLWTAAGGSISTKVPRLGQQVSAVGTVHVHYVEHCPRSSGGQYRRFDTTGELAA